MGTTGGTTVVSSIGSAKLGKKGFAAGLRPDPGTPTAVTEPGDEGEVTGEACGEGFASGEVGLLNDEGGDDEGDFRD